MESILELEIGLVKAFNWSLRDIDETSVESLLPFIGRIAGIDRKTRLHGNDTFLERI